MFDEVVVKSLSFDEAMVASAAEAAFTFAHAQGFEVPVYTFDEETGKYQDDKGSEPVVASLLASAVESSGAKFIIPLAIPTELASGDERSFEKNSITSRNLPLPLM